MTDQDLDQIRAVMQDMLAPIESRLDRIDGSLAALRK